MTKTITTFIAAVMLMGIVNAHVPQHQTTIPQAVLVKAPLSPFCKAIVQGDAQTVQKLIDLGADVNEKSLGLTPAIFAARYNKAEILQMLISNGADLSIKGDKQGFTARKYAELSNAKEALAVLDAAEK